MLHWRVMPETLLTVEEFASRTHQHAQTVRRQIRRGAVPTVRTGRKYLIPESAAAPTYAAPPSKDEASAKDTPQARAEAILAALESGDKERRNAAIIQLASSDEQTVEIVTEAAARAVEAWNGPEDDLSDWRALDGEPFHFPEESPDFLSGLYRRETKEKGA